MPPLNNSAPYSSKGGSKLEKAIKAAWAIGMVLSILILIIAAM